MKIMGVDLSREQKPLIMGAVIMIGLLVAPKVGDIIGKEVILRIKQLISPKSVNLIGGN